MCRTHRFPPASGRSACSSRRGRPCAAGGRGAEGLASLVSLRPHRPLPGFLRWTELRTSVCGA